MPGPSSHLLRALRRGQRAEPDAGPDWFAEPPAGTTRLDRRVPLPGGLAWSTALSRLTNWQWHRHSGLHVLADGPARMGVTVALGWGVGPLRLPMACRVVETWDEADGAGFGYATLPGHPERGVERFGLERTDTGIVFVVEAVSRPAHPFGRTVPRLARALQERAVGRYLEAATAPER